jgi:hypothetical protein
MMDTPLIVGVLTGILVDDVLERSVSKGLMKKVGRFYFPTPHAKEKALNEAKLRVEELLTRNSLITSQAGVYLPENLAQEIRDNTREIVRLRKVIHATDRNQQSN